MPHITSDQISSSSATIPPATTLTKTHHEAASDAARLASVWTARQRTADWATTQSSIVSFGNDPNHYSVHPVYPTGARTFLRNSALTRWLQVAQATNEFSFSTWASHNLRIGFTEANRGMDPIRWKQMLCAANKDLGKPAETAPQTESRIKAMRTVCAGLNTLGYVNRGDLHDLIQILRQDSTTPPEKTTDALWRLRSLLRSSQIWHERVHVEKALGGVLSAGEAGRWLRNYDYYLPLENVDAHKIHTQLKAISQSDKGFSPPPAETIHHIIQRLITDERRVQDIESNYAAVFKTSHESYYELLPMHIAKELKLGHLVVPAAVTSLSGTTIEPDSKRARRGGPASYAQRNPIGLMQPFIQNGIKPKELELLKLRYPALVDDIKLSLKEFQEASLFLAVTKQADLHRNNAYFVPDADGAWHIKLFDLARGQLPDGLVTRENGHKIALRSILMYDPYFQLPLSEENVALVKGWDLSAFRDTFDVDSAWRSKLDRELRELSALHQRADSAGRTLFGKDPTVKSLRAKDDYLAEPVKLR